MNAIHSSRRAARTLPGTPAFPHTPGAHQFSRADWIEVPRSMVRQHMLGGAFFLSRGADAFLEAKGLPLDLVLNWFSEPRGHVCVGDSMPMGLGLEAFFGFDEAQDGERAFFVEISLRDGATDH